MNLGRLTGSVGRGLAAGAVGTAAMTLGQTLEMRLRDRSGSTVPAQAAEKTLGIEPRNEAAEQRLTQAVHFAYGTAWGGVRGLLGGLGLASSFATPAHLGLVWGTGLAMLPAMGLAPSPTKWEASTLLEDLVHHGIYALVTGLAYEALSQRARDGR